MKDSTILIARNFTGESIAIARQILLKWQESNLSYPYCTTKPCLAQLQPISEFLAMPQSYEETLYQAHQWLGLIKSYRAMS